MRVILPISGMTRYKTIGVFMKRIIRAICAAAVTFSMITASAFSSFADATNGISVSETTLEQGDEFTVSLIVPPAEDADTASLRVLYDDTAFEGIEFAPDVPGSFTNLSNGIMALSAANATRAIKLGDGLTLTAKMKVRDNAPDGVYDFILVENSFCYLIEETWEFEELWFPETTKVSVTVGSPVAGTAVTAELQPPETTAGTVTAPTETAKSDSPLPMNSSDNVFIVIIIVIIAIVVAGIVFTIIALFKPKTNKK